MGRRAGKQQMHVRQRPNGSWEARFYIAEPDGIRRRRVSVYAPSQREALAKAREYLVNHARGLVPNPDRRRFEDFAVDVIQRHTHNKAPNTKKNYLAEIKMACGYIGDIPLQKIAPLDIRRMVDRLSERYQARTVAKVLERVRLVMREALALELIHRDPSLAVRLPRANERETTAQHLEPHQVRLLLEYADASKSPVMALLLRLLVHLGLRKGEALGLTWKDVDFSQGLLRIERQYALQGNKPAIGPLKTRAARRVIPLPPDLLARLEAHYQTQLEGGATPRLLEKAYVFGFDRPFEINSPNHYLRRLIARIQNDYPDFPPIRVHDLRHTAASLLLARGTDASLVADRLGHATPAVTMQIYRHLLVEERQAAMPTLEALLGGQRHQA